MLAGEPLYGKVALSPKRLAKFLYETLRLPKQVNRKTGGVTTAEVTIRRLLLKYGANPRVREAGELILDIRRKQKLAEFYQPAQTDADGRLRCSIRFTTDTGRLTASESPKGTGRNLFNVDREVRDTYVPEPGMIFVEADLSQAEDRVVGMLTEHPDLIALARTPPWELDVHRRNAAKIFAIAEADVTKPQRYVGKKAKHASNYGMQGKKLADELLKDGYVYTEDECQAMIDATRHPAILDWHRRVRAQVLAHRCLVNSWGRMRTFEYERLDDDTYRKAYAWQPQSEIPMLLNQYGFLPLDRWLAATGRQSVINLQVYDSLLVSCPPAEVWDVLTFVRTALEQPRRYAGRELTIPVGFKLGRTWRGDVEFTRPPARDEVEAAVARLAA